MAIFSKPKFVDRKSDTDKKKDMPQGLWTKCPACSEFIYQKELEANLMVCKYCDHHFPIRAHDRIKGLCDAESFQEMDADLETVDSLEFTAKAPYGKTIDAYVEKTGLKEAVVSGVGDVEGIRCSIAVMEFSFLGGSMGVVVGEKITRAIERGLEEKIPVIVFSASGGARMHEGIFSLMQMAKTSGALSKLSAKGIPYISVLTHPTMGGVSASYATLGDVILAEPKAMIGFAGARVIKETMQQDLPKGFQTSEFLLKHGLVDHIVSRNDMRSTLGLVLKYLVGK